MDWTLEKIRAKVRKLSGRPDEEALSTSDLDNYINHYYQNVFPIEAVPPELKNWFTENTTDGTESYAVDEKNLAFKEPFTIAGYPINYYLNPKLFYEKFPETQSYTKAQPTDVLFFKKTLLFRPPPDGVYQFKAQVILRPDPLILISDKPLNQLWGPVIAHAAAIEVKQDNGEFEEIEALFNLYQYYLALVTRQNLIDLQTQGSIPRY